MYVLCVTSDVEVGFDASDCRVMDQHLPTDHRHRWEQGPIAVHDSTILTTCLRPSHAGNSSSNYDNSNNKTA